MTQRRDLLQRFPGQLRLPQEQRNGLGRFLRGTSQVPGSDLRLFEIKDGILMRNHETRDFLKFLLELDCHQESWWHSLKKNTKGMQICGDLLWIKWESSKIRAKDLQDLPQGDARLISLVEALPPSIKLNHFWYASCQLDCFFGNVWIRSHDFFWKNGAVGFCHEELSPVNQANMAKGLTQYHPSKLS